MPFRNQGTALQPRGRRGLRPGTGRRSRAEEAGGWRRRRLGSLTEAHPSPCPGFPLRSRHQASLRTQYLGSRLQGRHKVFDHFGFRDCDSAHHEEDEERVVAGMRPAHLQTKHA